MKVLYNTTCIKEYFKKRAGPYRSKVCEDKLEMSDTLRRKKSMKRVIIIAIWVVLANIGTSFQLSHDLSIRGNNKRAREYLPWTYDVPLKQNECRIPDRHARKSFEFVARANQGQFSTCQTTQQW